MAISDYIANPRVAPIGQMVGQGMADRQQRQLGNLEFLMKQLQYSEAQKDTEINDMGRSLKKGQMSFDIENQPERLKRNKVQEDVDAEMQLDEQLLRGINDPRTYKRWSEAGVLPKMFYDESGRAMPFEATVEQRTSLARRAIDSTEHIRKKELAEIDASGRIPGYTAADPTNFQRDAGFDATRQALTDNDWKIGKLTDKSPTDAKQLYRAVTELTAQAATAQAKATGKPPNEQAIRQKILDIAGQAVMKNPKNEKAWGPVKWKYTDQIIDWDKFNKDIKDQLQIESMYTSPFSDALRVSAPAFTVKDFAKEKGMTTEEFQKALEATATKRDMTVEEVLQELNNRRNKNK